jgi:hypothetical protein
MQVYGRAISGVEAGAPVTVQPAKTPGQLQALSQLGIRPQTTTVTGQAGVQPGPAAVKTSLAQEAQLQAGRQPGGTARAQTPAPVPTPASAPAVHAAPVTQPIVTPRPIVAATAPAAPRVTILPKPSIMPTRSPVSGAVLSGRR